MSEAAGAHGTLVRHYREESVMGFVEVVKKLRKIQRSMAFCRTDIEAFQPAALILIDYPGFNLRMAKFAKSICIPTYYYIAPKVWAWKEKRIEKIRKYVDKLFVIFPFEVEYFRQRGIEAFYFGNPLQDSMLSFSEGDVQEFRRSSELSPEKPIVALVAGSRKHEIDYNLPTMLCVARRHLEWQFVITGVDWLDKECYTRHILPSDCNVKLLFNQTQQTISCATAALVTSGTATLETALYNVPQVVCFRGPKITIAIAKWLVKIRWISLVNIVMNRTVVTELIQENYTPSSARQELENIMPGAHAREKMMYSYAELHNVIGGPGASMRVAQAMVEMVENSRK